MLRVFTLLLALALLSACVARPAPEPNPGPACYDLQIICGDYRETVSVRSHWTELRPPSLELLCYVKCAGTRACVSTDGCTWLRMK